MKVNQEVVIASNKGIVKKQAGKGEYEIKLESFNGIKEDSLFQIEDEHFRIKRSKPAKKELIVVQVSKYYQYGGLGSSVRAVDHLINSKGMKYVQTMTNVAREILNSNGGQILHPNPPEYIEQEVLIKDEIEE